MKSALAFVLCIGVLSGSMVTVGCNSVTVLTDVEKFEPVVVNILNLACVIDASSPLCGIMAGTIKNDYDTVVQLWTDYNKAVAAGTSTSAAWNALNAGFTVFENDSALIFSLGLGLNEPEISAIVASAQILLATIEALFPSAPAGMERARADRPHPFAAYQVTNFNLKSWIADYNGKLETAHKLHPTAKVKAIKYHRYLWVM